MSWSMDYMIKRIRTPREQWIRDGLENTTKFTPLLSYGLLRYTMTKQKII